MASTLGLFSISPFALEIILPLLVMALEYWYGDTVSSAQQLSLLRHPFESQPHRKAFSQIAKGSSLGKLLSGFLLIHVPRKYMLCLCLRRRPLKKRIPPFEFRVELTSLVGNTSSVYYPPNLPLPSVEILRHRLLIRASILRTF